MSLSERYSGEILDRLCDPGTRQGSLPHAAIIAAHPDDEVLGAASRFGLFSSISFMQVTDGAPRNMKDATDVGFSSREAYARARYQELSNALDCAGLGCYTRHRLDIADQEASYNMAGLSCHIAEFVEQARPAVVLTHAYEGGHPDHDAMSFAVSAACSMLRRQNRTVPVVLEFALYHGANGYIEPFVFLPQSTNKDRTIELTASEQTLKQTMLSCFESQQVTLSYFSARRECFREKPVYQFIRPPHDGIMYYELFDWGMTSKRWVELAKEAMRLLDIEEVPI